MDKPNGEQHIVRSRLAYSLGAFGHDAFFALLSTYFMMYVTGHLFDSSDKAFDNRMVGYVTVIILVLRIGELIIDPMIGNAIDRTHTRWGKFKPWVVGGGVISAVLLAALFTPLGGLNLSNPILYLILFAIIYIIMDVFYSFNDVGFWSMVPAMSFDSHERDKIATFARVGSTIGGQIIGFVIMPMVLFFSVKQNGGTGDDRGWFIFAVIVAAISAITAIGVGMFTHEQQSLLRENKEQTKFKDILKILVKNDQLLAIAMSYLFFTTGQTLLNSFELYYFTYILGNSKAFSILGGLNTVVGVISVFLFPLFSGKIGRHKLFYGAASIEVLGAIIFAFAGKSLVLVLIGAELFFIPQPIIFLVVLMTITDSVEYGQLKLGHRDESLTLSVRPLLDKFGGAVANGVVGMATVAAGMTGGATAATVTAHGVNVFKIYMFLIPIALILVGIIIFAIKVKLDEGSHAKIVAELEKTWGKQFNKDDSDNDNAASEPAPQPVPGVTEIPAPVAGTVVDLKNVSDPAFANGSMGQGFAIKPSDGKVYAPFSGTVRATFSTRHAVGLVSDSGIALLIHVGIDTVKLHGTGFVTYFSKGQHVNKGDELMEFWDPTIKKAGLDDTVIVTVTNSEEFDFKQLINANQEVTTTDNVMEVTKKDQEK
ncbi:MAG: glycoside-pentoside-hexuronide (GPH):cation symporter [Limosilactobacillus sp.]|jgi:lactose/raffinose/galactose permease|uniref:glycoside-pentoside-hexuronide (GPH):cation symporter n=1 Tax=Limosilactobacillus sp. TaxID=2773925 RepID=UPI0025BF00B8|nr:glycoside-pentoside-hexuronide (GPH):cation symporter [Limosilactobacillus sp.]MCI1974313.1 glycoside-pentoside-hexuronide (GPH):cation symporter [Limosilactobacillus sp.]MCI2030428.1 glycoside-pentoside-hexuronide (GPH):cation symporter [Limosilactobacillus sp.]